MDTEQTGGRAKHPPGVDAVATAVVDADALDEDDAEAVAATVRGIADGGVLTDGSLQDALAHLSKVVSTPATRVELAGIELESAREQASEVSDVPTVAARFDEFAADVEAIESAVAELDSDLRTLADRVKEVSGVGGLSSDAAVELYEVATEREQIHTDALGLQATADDLTAEIESFQRWLALASVRHEALRTDSEELADAVDALEVDVETVADASEAGGDGRTGGEVAETWFDCSLRRRVLMLQVLDLRVAAADLETVDKRLESDPADSASADVQERVEELEDRLAALGGRLDAAARTEWHDRYDSRLAAFDEELERFDPPIDWGAVLSVLEKA